LRFTILNAFKHSHLDINLGLNQFGLLLITNKAERIEYFLVPTINISNNFMLKKKKFLLLFARLFVLGGYQIVSAQFVFSSTS